jgi:hypothetical protein
MAGCFGIPLGIVAAGLLFPSGRNFLLTVLCLFSKFMETPACLLAPGGALLCAGIASAANENNAVLITMLSSAGFSALVALSTRRGDE